MTAPTKPDQSERRAWERRVCEWLGLPIDKALHVYDNLGTLARPKPKNENLRLSIGFVVEGPLPTPPARCHFVGWDFEGDADAAVATMKLVLNWDVEAELLAEVGPKPSFMDAETELKLLGMQR